MNNSFYLFSTGAECVLFACHVLEKCLHLILPCGEPIIRLIAENHSVRKLSVRFASSLTERMKFLQHHVINTTCDLYSDNDHSYRSFIPEIDSRHNYRSEQESFIFNNRQKVFDSYCNLSRKFPKTRLNCPRTYRSNLVEKAKNLLSQLHYANFD